MDHGLVRNVQNILEEIHDYLRNPGGGDEGGIDLDMAEKARRLTGKFGSLRWQLFTLRVIEHLKEEGSFHDEDTGRFDTFDDTAGGCDEVTQDAAIWVIEHSD